MDNLLTLKYQGIKCDNPACSFMDYDVTFNMYVEYVNKPCPLCGENLMTEECYANIKSRMDKVERFNKVANFVIPRFIRKKLLHKSTKSVFGCDVNGNPTSVKYHSAHIDAKV